MKNPFFETREAARIADVDPQARNRGWWERMPMTYEDWHAENRLPNETEYFSHLIERVLNDGPWLKSWFATHRFDGLRVLDLGCGSGVFSCALAQRGAEVTAVDITEAGVHLARKTAEAHGLSLTTARMDAEKLGFPSNAFNFVYSWGVLHHTANMECAVQEAGRVLKPNGRGIIMVYHRTSVVYWLHGLFWLIARGKVFSGHNFRTVQDFYTDGYYHRYLTAGELTEMLEKANLRADRFTVTQYRKKILPLIPTSIDEFLKTRFGMCLVVEFTKGAPPSPRKAFGGANAAPANPTHSRIWAAGIWIWVIAATAAYLYQFRDLARPILALFGIGK